MGELKRGTVVQINPDLWDESKFPTEHPGLVPSMRKAAGMIVTISDLFYERGKLYCSFNEIGYLWISKWFTPWYEFEEDVQLSGEDDFLCELI